MKNREEIITAIKLEIRKQIVGQFFNFKGQPKKVLKFDAYWQRGFDFIEEFELATVPINGPITNSVRFSCWVNLDIDGNSSRKVLIDGQFGPFIISFSDNNYELDVTNATFSRIEIDQI